jgi:DNA modification methylase
MVDRAKSHARTRTTPVDEAWRSRIVGTGAVDPDDVEANPANWRIHPEVQALALSGVLDEVGWVQQVIVNRTTGHLVDGHLRVILAKRRGEGSVPVVYVELTEEEEALVLATFDPISTMALADPEKTGELLRRIGDHEALGALLDQIRHVPERAPDTTGADEIPKRTRPRVRNGDLWKLGRHVMVCGDSREPETYERLLGEGRADMVFTDPPYGLDYSGKTRERLKIRGDDPDSLDGLLRSVFTNALASCRPGAPWYVCAPAGENLDVFTTVLRQLDLRRHTLIWKKDSPVLSRIDYHYSHETILYGWAPGPHPRVLDRTQTSVWEIDRPKASPDHPTQKPVELVSRAISNSSSPGAMVLDPFAGSGTTLIAAELSGRRAFICEIDPRYADVAIARFEALNPERAELIDRKHRRPRGGRDTPELRAKS